MNNLTSIQQRQRAHAVGRSLRMTLNGLNIKNINNMRLRTEIRSRISALKREISAAMSGLSNRNLSKQKFSEKISQLIQLKKNMNKLKNEFPVRSATVLRPAAGPPPNRPRNRNRAGPSRNNRNRAGPSRNNRTDAEAAASVLAVQVANDIKNARRERANGNIAGAVRAEKTAVNRFRNGWKKLRNKFAMGSWTWSKSKPLNKNEGLTRRNQLMLLGVTNENINKRNNQMTKVMARNAALRRQYGLNTVNNANNGVNNLPAHIRKMMANSQREMNAATRETENLQRRQDEINAILRRR